MKTEVIKRPGSATLKVVSELDAMALGHFQELAYDRAVEIVAHDLARHPAVVSAVMLRLDPAGMAERVVEAICSAFASDLSGPMREAIASSLAKQSTGNDAKAA